MDMIYYNDNMIKVTDEEEEEMVEEDTGYGFRWDNRHHHHCTNHCWCQRHLIFSSDLNNHHPSHFEHFEMVEEQSKVWTGRGQCW